MRVLRQIRLSERAASNPSGGNRPLPTKPFPPDANSFIHGRDNRMIKKPSSRRVRGLLALLATPLLGLALAGPASAAADPPATPTVVSWTDTAGHVNSARALTAS